MFSADWEYNMLSTGSTDWLEPAGRSAQEGNFLCQVIFYIFKWKYLTLPLAHCSNSRPATSIQNLKGDGHLENHFSYSFYYCWNIYSLASRSAVPRWTVLFLFLFLFNNYSLMYIQYVPTEFYLFVSILIYSMLWLFPCVRFIQKNSMLLGT